MKLRIPLAAALAVTAVVAVAPAPASAQTIGVPNPCTKEPATPSCQEYVAATTVELVESADAIVSALRSDVFVYLRAVEDTGDEVVNEEVCETLFERNDCSD